MHTDICIAYKFYIGETGRRQGDRFREHLRDVETIDKDASKPVARHFNLPNNYKSIGQFAALPNILAVRKAANLYWEQKFIFQIGTPNSHGIKERSIFQIIYSCFLVTILPPIP